VGPLEGYSAGLIVEEAIRWLGATESNRPFYLQVCFHEPHEPVASPPELVKKYLAKSRNEDEAHYFANVENVDRAVGRLTTYLAKEGLTSNTLICFTSDNGPETLNRYRNANRSYGSPGALKGMKLWTSEAGFRVPGILHWPAVVQPGLISARIVSALDFLPTFCALAGSPLPKRTLDGTDISGLLRGQGFVRTKPLLWCYYNAINERRVALRSGDWKILAALHHQGNPLPKLTNVHGGNRETVAAAQLADFELYHLSDSSEATEVTAVFPERLAAMKKELEHHYRALSQDSHIWNR
jgi:arylsulfatase A